MHIKMGGRLGVAALLLGAWCVGCGGMSGALMKEIDGNLPPKK
jgi:hypothetical protein